MLLLCLDPISRMPETLAGACVIIIILVFIFFLYLECIVLT